MVGYIQQYDGENLLIVAPLLNGERELIDKKIGECEVTLHDGRELSPKQRRKIFALVNDITAWASGMEGKRRVLDETLRMLQLNYLIDLSDKEEIRRALAYRYCDLLDIDLFSLASHRAETIDMSTARDFIDWLVELCVEYGVPCIDTLLNRCEDIERYLYACAMHRSCAICGYRNGKADWHHVDHVGTGNDRNKIHHLGLRGQPLCRLHHTEVGMIGQESFDKKYHLQSIPLDEKLCKRLGLKV